MNSNSSNDLVMSRDKQKDKTFLQMLLRKATNQDYFDFCWI